MENNQENDVPDVICVGEEKEHSWKLLYQAFCNNLYLGQWELAKSCIAQLHEEGEASGVRIVDVLRDVASHPYNRSLGSDLVALPHQLSWLCLLEYENLQSRSISEELICQDSISLRQENEFRLLLFETGISAEVAVLQELYNSHQRVHRLSASTWEIKQLSPQTLLFLQETLLSKPVLGSSLIEEILTIGNDSTTKNNDALQLLYVEALNSLLNRILIHGSKKKHVADNCDKIYDILSLFNPEAHSIYIPVKQLIIRLLELSKAGEGPLHKTRLMSVLIGRSSCYLIEEFCKIDFDWQMKHLHSNNSSGSLPNCSDSQLDILVVLRKKGNPESRWNHLLQLCLKRKIHLMEAIIDSSLLLIQAGLFVELGELLEPIELQPLKPLILLLGWNHCYSCANARSLLHTLWGDEATSRHPALYRGCQKLSYQINLIQWCLEKAKPMLLASGASTTHHQRATDMFQGLENHSVLYVLHQSTKLSSLEQTEVLQLLQKSPTSAENQRPKRVKAVRFKVDESKDDNSKECISIEQERDVAVYRSYCILKNISDALHFCHKYGDIELMHPVQTQSHSDRGFSCSTDSSVSDDSVLPSDDNNTLKNEVFVNSAGKDSEDFPLIYKTQVTDRLDYAKKHMSKLQPLTYRLEVAENIFSMLFVTPDDIQETMVSGDSDSEDEPVEDRTSLPESPEIITSLNLEDSHQATVRDKLFGYAFDRPKVSTKHSDNTPMATTYDQPLNDAVKLSSSVNQTNSKGSKLERLNLKTKKVNEQNNFKSRTSIDNSQNASGYTSTGSSGSLLKLGFIPNEYLVRDILAWLKDSLLELSSLRYQIQGKHGKGQKSEKSTIDPHLEKSLTDWVLSAISEKMFQSKMVCLTKYVNEAQWRYQLVSHDLVPSATAQVLNEVVYIPATDADENLDLDLLGRNNGRRKRRHSSRRQHSGATSSALSSNASGMESDVHGSSSRMDSEVHGSSSSSRRSRTGSSGSLRFVSRPFTSIVPRMLATPQTLLTMCLHRGNYTQAGQVVKLFNLESSPEGIEVRFSEPYLAASKKLHNLGGISRQRSIPKVKSGKLSISALASVAAAGVATASVVNITDELLRSTNLPSLPMPKDLSSLVPSVSKHFKPELVSAMILFDLACSSCKTWDVCNNMLDVVKAHVPQPPTLDVLNTQGNEPRRPNDDGMVGFQQFLSDTETRVHLGNAPTSINDDHTSSPFKQSIQEYLTLASQSLSCNGLRQMIHSSSEIHKAVTRVENTFMEHKREIFTHSPQLSGSSGGLSRENSPRSSPKSLRKSTKPEQPPVHNAMKQLILVLEQQTPPGGALKTCLRSSSGSAAANRNYLLSLYEHVKELAFLVAQCEAKSKDTIVIPKNYFRMLDEGPILILGRLMFAKGMPPARLEKVARKLSLNLTHIIVHSCCPRIPSKPIMWPVSAFIDRDPVTCGGRLVMNIGRDCSDSIQHPELVVRHLLTKLLHLLKETARDCTARGVFDSSCLPSLLSSTELSVVLQRVDELRFVDINLLSSKEDKLCFYSNLLNLMSVHRHLYQAYKSRLAPSTPASSDEVFPFDPSRTSALDNLIHLSSFAYHVGQLGVVSVFDVKFIISHYGLSPPKVYGHLIQSRVYALDAVDPWVQFAPDPEPRLLYVTSDGTVSSPPIVVLIPDLVETQLSAAKTDYLSANVLCEENKQLVSLPELLVWYKDDFVTSDVACSNEYEGLINYIIAESLPELKDRFSRLVQMDGNSSHGANTDTSRMKILPYHVDIEEHNYEFAFVFDYKVTQKSIQRLKSQRRSLSLPVDMELSGDGYQSGQNSPPGNQPSYQLTPVTLEYIKTDSALIATLVSLVCEDELDDIEEHFTDDHYAESDQRLKKRSQSDINLVDIRSYRYQKLTIDFPVLKQHLLNYVVPLALPDYPDMLRGGDPILKFMTSNINKTIKTCMLNLHGSAQFQKVLIEMINNLCHKKKWLAILTIIDSIPECIREEKPDLKILHDFILCCLLSDSVRDSSVDLNVYLRQCHDINTQARTILGALKKLSIHTCIDLLEMCLASRDLDEPMKNAIKIKLKELFMYRRITECATNLQFQLSMKKSRLSAEHDEDETLSDHGTLDKFTNWHNVSASTTIPSEVLAVLLKAKDFDTAKAWTKFTAASDVQNTEEHQLVHMLTCPQPNHTKAFLALEQVRQQNRDTCLTLCETLLDKISSFHDILFIAGYTLNQIGEELPIAKQDQLLLMCMGAKGLLCLPESIRRDYIQLLSSPKLLLEQLLMNRKADLAGQVYTTIQPDLVKISDPSHCCFPSDFDRLVTTYATKALEFAVVEGEYTTDQRVRTNSRSSASDFESDRLSRSSPAPRTHLDIRRQSTSSAVSPRNYSLTPAANTTLSSSPARRQPTPTKNLTAAAGEHVYVFPAEPPPKDKWIPDAAVSKCMACNVERFSMFSRRHHCRRCGRVVCAACSTRTLIINGVSARTCDDCYGHIYVKPGFKDEPDLYQQRIKDRMSGVSEGTPHLSGARNDTPVSHSSFAGSQGPADQDLAGAIHHIDHQWKLQLSSDHNNNVRDDFYYEQAPSTSLCMSILHLHSNQKECGQLMLKFCDDLSKHLRPIAPGVPNPEVDYSLVISMMKTLLFHAKMKFIRCSATTSLGLCDTYQIRVDLLKQMVASHYQDLPSIQELTKVEIVRRLRDKLIEAERLPLAMEVSTKCGLDPTGVWAAWGMACLHSGDYSAGREKFTRCLKAPVDRHQSQPSKLLSDIIACLESMPSAANTEVQLLKSSAGSMQKLLYSLPVRYFDGSNLDASQLQECRFYLKAYGTHGITVDFFRRNNCWQKAVKYVLDYKCMNSIFIESLLTPAVYAGDLRMLLDEMYTVDPSLVAWETYLMAACRHLDRSRLHNVLYHIQLYSKDYIRAAMTCISHFYQRGALSYLDLAKRTLHLYNAQSHLQSYLDPSKWGSIRRPVSNPSRQGWENTTENSFRLVLSAEEVNKNMSSIALQIDITKFFEKCISTSDGGASSDLGVYENSPRKKSLLTVFGNAKIRSDLAALILLTGKDLKAGFSLSFKIIKEYRLGAVAIFTHSARELVKNQQYPLIPTLLECMRPVGYGDDDTVDEIVGACIVVVSDKPTEAKEAEFLIKLLRKDSNKINANILCGKLKSAYLLAVKGDRIEDVQRIAGASQRMGQTSVKNICEKWLLQRKH